MNDASEMDMPPLPKTLGGLVAYVTIDGTRKAAEFYKAAFGAEEKYCMPPDEKGRTMHLHMYINGSTLMMSDPYPEYGHPFKGHEGFALQLVVTDIDVWWDRAVKAGAEVVMPVEKMFWGDRYGQLRDPFGIIWGLNEAAATG